ncbi:MAG: hypothetical protein JRN52_04050 [Nitrososphaerota archaeon]|nr:hypothetical protein [Nitrososphaerota archaeon]
MSQEDVSVILLKKLSLDNPIPYYAILEDAKLKEKLGNAENISALLYQLLAQGYAAMNTKLKENGEEEITLSLTDHGNYFIKFKTSSQES